MSIMGYQLQTIDIITIIFIAGAIIGFLGTKFAKKRLENDPELQKKLHERQMDAIRRREEEQELEDIAYSMGSGEDFDDSDSEE